MDPGDASLLGVGAAGDAEAGNSVSTNSEVRAVVWMPDLDSERLASDASHVCTAGADLVPRFSRLLNMSLSQQTIFMWVLDMAHRPRRTRERP